MPGTASWQTKVVLILGMIGAVTALVFSKDSAGRTLLPLGGQQAGGPRLISVEPLPEPEGALCTWLPASANLSLAATLQQGPVSAAPAGAVPDKATRRAASLRKPLRMIRDPHSSFSSVAVDPIRNEVVFTDENLHGVLVYDRRTPRPRQPSPSRSARLEARERSSNSSAGFI